MKETLFHMKGTVWFLIVAILFSILSVAFISFGDLSLLAQTEIIYLYLRVVLAVGVIISVILCSVNYSHEREAQTLEAMLLTPVKKPQFIAGKLLSSLTMSLGIYIIAIPYVMGLCHKTGLTFMAIGLLFGIGITASIAYAVISFGISILTGNSKSAIIVSVIFVAFTALPSFISTTQKKAGFAAFIRNISPVSRSFKIINDMLINKYDLITVLPYTIPLLVLLLLGIVFLIYCSRRISFKGGE